MDAQEYSALRQFFEGLDEAGLEIPNEIFVRHYLDHVAQARMVENGHDHRAFLTDPAIKTFTALAQHHGVPTRFLDWTGSGLRAAYFAVREAALNREQQGFCAVWALSSSFIIDTKLSKISNPYPPDDVQIMTAPRSSNPNLHAQDGLFVAWFGDPGLKSLDSVVSSLFKQLAPEMMEKWLGQSPLVKFELPWSAAPAALRMLADEKVDGQRMFPGRDGVVISMKEKSLWDRTR